MHVARGLTELLREQQDNEVPPGVRALAEQLLARYGSCVQAILFYGSCLRDRTDEGLVDLYVLVDRYRSLPCGWIERCLHRILRPTVYYLEIPFDGRAVRCKFSVLSLRDFQRATSMRWFHSYFWGRFAQRTALLYVRDEEIAQQVRAALAQAVLTLLIRVLPTLPAAFETRDLWQKALSLSYKAELRAERPQTILHLYDAATEYYEKVTHAAMAAVPFPCSTVTGPVADRYSVSVSIWKRHMSHLAHFAKPPALVAVSGTGQFQLHMAEALGAKYTLQKPLTPEILVDAVDRALADAAADAAAADAAAPED